MKDMAETPLVIGKITAAYGIKGWVKIHSYTDKPGDIFNYHFLLLMREESLRRDNNTESVKFSGWRPHGKGIVAHIDGCDDRTTAETYLKAVLCVNKDQLPVLPADHYYWNQLIGLTVFTQVDEHDIELGEIASLMETGANDVLVVQPTATSVDEQERLVPYLLDQFVLNIDLTGKRMDVDWDPTF